MISPKNSKLTDNNSRGCQLCQKGKWLCIYLTYLCNAKCVFCPAPFKQEDKIISAFGDSPEGIYQYLNSHNFEGISFSGGDCFLVFDRLMKWLSFFKKRCPDMYYWAYTNGLAADENKLNQLANAGLNEIRFNIAATNYNSPAILAKISLATELIKNVAVEIPSIPTDYHKLTNVLPYLDKINVKFLNLHEYILVPNDPYTKIANKNTFILNKEATLIYDKNSLQNTVKIKKFCKNQALKIQVNNCSLHKKEVQMLYRRLTMGEIFKREYDQLTQDGLLENYFIYPGKLTMQALQELIMANNNNYLERYFVHPQAFKKHMSNSSCTVAKLSFLPPLSKNEKPKLLKVECCEQDHGNVN